MLLLALLLVLPWCTLGLKLLSAGSGFFNSIQADGQVYSWGRSVGLGLGRIDSQAFPLAMPGVMRAVDICADRNHVCLLDLDQGVKCTGFNNYGQLGDGTLATNYSLVHALGLQKDVTEVHCGNQHTCVLLTGGGMKCHGHNYFGQLGDGTKSPNEPMGVFVKGFESSGVSAASTGAVHTCIVTVLGAALCSGNNFYHQLGDGTFQERYAMVPVARLAHSVVRISAGWYHSCAVLEDGSVFCWGTSSAGELGNGRLKHRA